MSQFIDLERILRGQYGLTASELIVISCLAECPTRKEIANKLHVSIHTVDSHLAGCFKKLGVRNKADAIGKLYSLAIPSAPANFLCFG